MDNELNLALKIAAAYIRVSDERQDEYSPDSQLKKIREYAEKEGYTVPDDYVFYDDGISGRNVKKRNDFNRMVATAKEKDCPFDKIYVWKFSRFARNQEQAIVYKSMLAKKNVSVVSVSEPVPEGPFGSLIERIIEWMDEYYSINLSVEVTRGMEEKITRGEPVCPPAFGYYLKDKRYYPDEAEAPIVKEVFERFVAGEGMRKIAVDLGQRGIRTKFGNMPDNRYIEFMLYNPLYIGKLRYSLNGASAVSKRDYRNENIMIKDGQHEPIISVELWEKAQKRLDEIKVTYGKHARKEQPVMVMCKGLVRCSACGATLAMSSAKSGKEQKPTMQCCNYSRGNCHTSHSVVVPTLEAAIMEGLKTAIGAKTFQMSPEKKKSQDTKGPDFEKLIGFEEKKLERAKAAYLAEIDSIEQYAQNKKDIEKRIADLVALRDKEETTHKPNLDDYTKKVSDVVSFIESPEPTLQAKNEALRTIVEKIIYHKPSGKVQIFFYD